MASRRSTPLASGGCQLLGNPPILPLQIPFPRRAFARNVADSLGSCTTHILAFFYDLVVYCAASGDHLHRNPSNGRMPALSDYYKDLQIWENVDRRALIAGWPVVLVDSVILEFQTAIAASDVIGIRCPIRKRSTNQSIGNQVEAFVIPLIAARLSGFDLRKCAGAGYPDRELIQRRCGLKISLEVKATSDWNPSDSSRRVLTSSSDKLRTQFREPIHHLLCIILYEISSQVSAKIKSVRLDFLEPTTVVGVRLEASVSHKILCSGSHRSIVF